METRIIMGLYKSSKIEEDLFHYNNNNLGLLIFLHNSYNNNSHSLLE